MREVKLSGGDTRKVSPLTRKQVKSLSPLGVDSRGFHPDVESFDAAFDGVLHTQFTDEQLDALPFPDVRELFFGILAETWGSEAEEKNSLRSGQSDQTASE